MDQALSRRPLTTKERGSINPRLVHVGSAVDQVALRQGFLRELGFSSVRIIPSIPLTHLCVADATKLTASYTSLTLGVLN
jgi:hypothetical protein